MSKKTEEESGPCSELFGVVPYIDPKKLGNLKYSLNEKSDVYSVGMLLWELSSGQPPFKDFPHDVELVMRICQGQRETMVLDTPVDYFNLYNGKFNIHTVIALIN